MALYIVSWKVLSVSRCLLRRRNCEAAVLEARFLRKWSNFRGCITYIPLFGIPPRIKTQLVVLSEIIFRTLRVSVSTPVSWNSRFIALAEIFRYVIEILRQSKWNNLKKLSFNTIQLLKHFWMNIQLYPQSLKSFKTEWTWVPYSLYLLMNIRLW